MQFVNYIASSCVLSCIVVTLFFNSLLEARPIGSDANSQGQIVADYIIIGAGTAGAGLARRLSEDGKTKVLVLHSGQNLMSDPLIKYSKNVFITVPAALLGAPLPFDPNTLDIPPETKQELLELMAASQEVKSLLYETGPTTPQTAAHDRVLFWAIGLPGGGLSSVNGGAWCRGTDQLYSQWEGVGGQQWSVNQITNTYKQLEAYDGSTFNPNVRGYAGPLAIRQVKHPSMVSKVFSQAMIDATGFPFVLDYNDPATPIGVSTQFQLAQHGPEGDLRTNSQQSFLHKYVMKQIGIGYRKRKLHVLFGAQAMRAVWDGSSNRVAGVEYFQDGFTKIALANKAVIVCAGLRSSVFLQQSGIGPSGVLSTAGVPQRLELPVGVENLADQPHIVLVFTSNPRHSPPDPNTIFTQISWLPAPGGDPLSRQLRLATLGGFPGITLAVFDLVQPKSRGSIEIVNSDPLSQPEVDLCILEDQDDVDLYMAGFKTYIKNLNIALQAIDPSYKLIFPDPAIIDDDVALDYFIRERVNTNHHFQCHCQMGSVVDSNGLVIGTQNLFVADNSIVPVAMDGSPMASGYLIAANIARLLGY